jgi:L-alanine-DL-glutamate epimerase-like enolase superfamily enzyme
VKTPIAIDRNGEIAAPDRPGLSVDVDIAAAKNYLLDVEIKVSGKLLYRTPSVG